LIIQRETKKIRRAAQNVLFYTETAIKQRKNKLLKNNKASTHKPTIISKQPSAAREVKKNIKK